ncbi:MAG: PepSY domain-containing protein, partial [Acidobacteriota bacterium]
AVLAFTMGIAKGENGKESEERVTTSPIMSLEDAITAATTRFQGRVVEAELEDEDGKVVYEVKILGDDGQTREIEVDANSGKLTVEESEDTHGADSTKAAKTDPAEGHAVVDIGTDG